MFVITCKYKQMVSFIAWQKKTVRIYRQFNHCIVLLTTDRWFVTSIPTVCVTITVVPLPYALTRVTSPLVFFTCCIHHTKNIIWQFSILSIYLLNFIIIIIIIITIIIITVVVVITMTIIGICIVQTCWLCIIYIFNSHSPHVCTVIPLIREIAFWLWNYQIRELLHAGTWNVKCFITDKYELTCDRDSKQS